MALATFLQHFLNALQWGSFYALIALGYTMVYGVLLLINFAHGDIFMVGAYIGFFIAAFLLGLGTGIPVWIILAVTILGSMALTAGVGVTIERIAYRPMRERGANRLYVVITALMIGLFLEYLNLSTLGAADRGFPELIPTKIYSVGGVSFTNIKLIVIGLSVVVMVGLELFLRRTKWGMAMRAISYDRTAVPLMGVPVNGIITVTFIIGSSLAALAGIMYGSAYHVISFDMGIIIGWKAFIAAVVGGIGEVRGAMVGGFLLGFIEIFVVALGSIPGFEWLSSTYRDLVSFTILLVILTIKPTGLFGVARRQKV
ncbi:MAG: branched-chain amino acid ABC transporter permease [Chloroflexi bacterium]|nr:MAG: branched-chain amino acid ABC transporter permease [Anaerolineaceae bacterium 4572_32.2]RLC81040.1 MAG: branched-chain amino acid ABC transporter permease [Chloroflexota bacterium]RLC84922.1 MAG: branched-chain amino acid ABC transporter permease [Chloroflexota bacterium]